MVIWLYIRMVFADVTAHFDILKVSGVRCQGSGVSATGGLNNGQSDQLKTLEFGKKEAWILILKKIKILKIESIPNPFNYLKFHKST